MLSCISYSLGFSTNNSIDVVILVLVKNDGDDTKRNPLEEFARPCRNPFAIKKPLFGKDNDTLKKEQSISQIISGIMT